MNGAFFRHIDWDRPWLRAFRAAATPLLEAEDWLGALNAAAEMRGLSNHCGLPLRFLPQAALPEGVAYESFISDSGGIPTRDNLHDFFNALAWLTFPRIKRQLNAIQAGEIEKAGGVATRGKVRDAVTIFDENAALLATCDMQWLSDLREHRWHRALSASRALFGHSVDVCLFGHALLEKLTAPYKAITAHAWAVAVEPAFFSLPPEARMKELDAIVARQLSPGLGTRDFTPLPVLGVPGWWEGQDDAFYGDGAVFRPKRGVA